MMDIELWRAEEETDAFIARLKGMNEQEKLVEYCRRALARTQSIEPPERFGVEHHVWWEQQVADCEAELEKAMAAL